MDEKLITYIRKIIAEYVDLIDDVESLSNDLTEYGLDSLSFVKVMIRIEEDYDVCIDDYEFGDIDEYASINDLVRLIKDMKN